MTPASHSARSPPTSLAYFIYTSGSTGAQGVMVPHRAVVNFLNSMRKSPGLTGQDAVLAVTTLSFDIAALEVFLPLTVCARLIVASREEARRRRADAQMNDTARPSCRPRLRRGAAGGGRVGRRATEDALRRKALPRELGEELLGRGESLWNMYGPTETTIWSALHRWSPLRQGRPHRAPRQHACVPVDAALAPCPSAWRANFTSRRRAGPRYHKRRGLPPSSSSPTRSRGTGGAALPHSTSRATSRRNVELRRAHDHQSSYAARASSWADRAALGVTRQCSRRWCWRARTAGATSGCGLRRRPGGAARSVNDCATSSDGACRNTLSLRLRHAGALPLTRR